MVWREAFCPEAVSFGGGISTLEFRRPACCPEEVAHPCSQGALALLAEEASLEGEPKQSWQRLGF